MARHHKFLIELILVAVASTAQWSEATEISAPIGHTDRVIIVWKNKGAEAIAPASTPNLPASMHNAKALDALTSRSSVAATIEVDHVRMRRLERVTSVSSKSGFRIRTHRRMSDGAEVMQLPRLTSAKELATLRTLLLSDPEIAEVYPDRLYYPTQALQPAFPANCVLPPGWTTPAGASSGWSTATDRARSGACSLRSNAISDSQSAQIQTSGVFPAGNVSFFYNVSSESNWDCLRFYVDGVQRSELGTCGGVGGFGITGEVANWPQVSVSLPAGSHTFLWSYEKDPSISNGADAAWIDDVVLPGTNGVVDPLFSSQWSLVQPNGINAPGAWGTTTGSPNLTIGIIDTGKLDHVDLSGKWIGGYDFVSLAARENDTVTQPGRDSDPSDPGDWVTAGEATIDCPQTNSRWHGTAMAGIIGANANNAIGIAGINWNSRLLPVRVVGKCGGYESDIADGMRWAAGLSVAGVAANPNPVKLLNVSLAAAGSCAVPKPPNTTPMQSAINDVLARGGTIIVSAGNNGNASSAANYSPGNCTGVITVGATDKFGGLPSYANTGSPITLSAPGGANTPQGSSTTTAADAILTTGDSGAFGPTGSNNITITGTSAAAAHVTGVAGLVLGMKPFLSATEIADILRNTSRAFPSNATASGSLRNCTVADCGQGILEATRAVGAATQWANATPAVSGGDGHSLALTKGGLVFAWGSNASGELGEAPSVASPHLVPQVVPGLDAIVRVAAGNRFSLALRADGVVFAWGQGGGQLGDGTFTARSKPVVVNGLRGIVAIAVGENHSIALRNDGTIWAWGLNSDGQLGDGTNATSAVPVQVTGLTGVSAIAAGSRHSLALMADGTLWTWGTNQSGQLGSGSSPGRSSPAQVGTFTDWRAIAGGSAHSLALRANGNVYAWGANHAGQLGNGNNIDSATPVLVSSISNITGIAAGGAHSLALHGDGAIFSWGSGAGGQLGNNAITSRNVPGIVIGLGAMSSISAGGGHSLAVDRVGGVWSWGFNNDGQLGDSSVVSRLLPVQTSGATGLGLMPLNIAAPVFAFGSVSAVGLGTFAESNPVYTTSGVSGSTPISVTNGEYRIDGASFTSAPGTIAGNQRVTVRLAASATCNTTTSATLVLEGVARTFSITTGPCDVTPDFLSFNQPTSVDPGTPVVSAPVTISGLTAPVPISISRGEYSIGCTGIFTALDGTIQNGQTLCVRLIAPNTFGTTIRATITIGGGASQSGVSQFAVTTKPAAGFAVTPQVATTGTRRYVLRGDGIVYASGSTYLGTLGLDLNHYRYFTAPQAVPVINRVRRIASGGIHFLALQDDGTVWLAGYHPLGDGTIPTSLSGYFTPVKVPNLSGITEISAGRENSLALRNDGTVWSWGFGEAPRQVTQLVGLSAATAIASGKSCSAAIENGLVWVWGLFCPFKSMPSPEQVPTQVTGLSNVVRVALGNAHMLALKNDGTVWVLGSNAAGQLGLGFPASFGSGVSVPTQIPNLSGVVAISANAAGLEFSDSSFALKNDGTVWAWGSNNWGKLGINVKLDPYSDFPGPEDLVRTSPIKLTGLNNVIAFAAGDDASMAVTGDGKVFRWGKMDFGDTGTPRTIAVTSPVALEAPDENDAFYATLTDTLPDAFSFTPSFAADRSAAVISKPVVVTGISAATSPVSIVGGQYSVGCTGTYASLNGTVSNSQSICVRVVASASYEISTTATLTIGAVATSPGRSATFHVRTRRNPSAIAVVPKVHLGSLHTLLLNPDGTVSAAGYNGNGQLGNGTTFSSPVMRPVPGLGGVRRIASGANHALALRSDGTIVSWGYNAAGQLGYGGLDNSKLAFVSVSALGNVEAVAAGDFHSLALVGGKVYAWGLNTDGQLGVGPGVPFSSTPLEVVGLTDIVAIAAGGLHSLALRVNGTVVAWGMNRSGQLGNGGNASSNIPIAVSGLSSVAYIAAGGLHSLALKIDASVAAWGDNSSGQLGDGLTTNRNLPFGLPTLSKVGLIAAGNRHSLAVVAGGALYAWGNNVFAQLGNGAGTNQSSPILVGGRTNIVAIAGGGSHSAAIDADRNLFTWGDNFFGQIGNKGGNYSPRTSALNLLRGDSSISAGAGSQSTSVQPGSNSGTGIFKVPSGADKDYGDIPLNVFSSPRYFEFANNTIDANGGRDLTIASIATEDPFSIDVAGSTCPLSPNRLTSAAGLNTCKIAVLFKPTVALPYSRELKVTSETGGDVIALVGQGVAALPTLLPTVTGQDFPAQESGTISLYRGIAITNQGTSPLTITSLAPPSGFFASHNCISVMPGGSCSVQIAFAPTAFQDYQGELTVVSNAATNPVLLKVYGQGVLSATASSLLTISRVGAGSGTVTGSGINCTPDCTESYANGTPLVMVATTNAGSVFSGWSGAVCNGGNSSATCSFAITGATTLTATFNTVTSGATVPGSPTITGTFPGNGQIIISFVPPSSDGGAAISSYTAICNPGTVVATSVSSPITVTGLTNGVSYTCTLAANNSAGNSVAAVSANVAPVANPTLALVGVQSRKTHLGVGTFNIDITPAPLNTDSVTVEPRIIGAGHLIVFLFNQSISNLSTVTATDALTLAPVIGVSAAVVGNNIEVTLPTLADNKRVRITVDGVNGVSATITTGVGFLVGDVNNTRSVNASDINGVKARSGQPTTSSNFKFDLNTSGAVNASDISAVKARSGLALP